MRPQAGFYSLRAFVCAIYSVFQYRLTVTASSGAYQQAAFLFAATVRVSSL